MVGLLGVRRVKPSGPSSSSSRGGEGLDRLQVGAGAEGEVAAAGEDHDARVVVVLEPLVRVGQQRGGRAVDRVAALLAVDGDDRGRAAAFVEDLLGVECHAAILSIRP